MNGNDHQEVLLQEGKGLVLAGRMCQVGELSLWAGLKLLQEELLGQGRQQDVVCAFCFVLDCVADEN